MSQAVQETPWAREKRRTALAAAFKSVPQEDVIEALRDALTEAGHDPRAIGFRLGLKS